jgi:positive regulator of sigma E activity
VIKARVVENRDGVALLQPEAAGCGGCQGCGVRLPRTFELPNRSEQAGSVIALSMSPTNQLFVLLNTLWLPLLGFVLGVMIGSSLSSSEIFQVFVGLAGLLAGLAGCRRLEFSRITASQ